MTILGMKQVPRTELRTMSQDPAGPPGQLYQGELEAGVKHGTGVLQFEIEGFDGVAIYRGDFRQNKKHGHGTMEWPDGRTYCGKFLNDSFHGEAIMTWADGHRYEGRYVNGKKEGHGVLSTPNGNKFIGQFHEGKRQGDFIYIRADSTTVTLTFDKDKLCQSTNPCLEKQLSASVSEGASSLESSVTSSASQSTKCSDQDVKRQGPTHSAPQKWRITDPGGAVVRYSDSLKSQKVGTLRQNEELTVVKACGRRLQVVSPMEGWVSYRTEDGLKIMARED
eukprot:gnl/MRDRNA2_/MRDRNA2_87910_c0_seq1.p1 gnl/MRDRNA2_/MRDRNA2_87910_c0~~gnl/MRDRNA2_/MRDRNA2_87910_c0_seq1.p1  ORF type:complete len:279 (+),score=45.02 gnl/MRDRNA2_/MRDRNA2_87910_c0_seq1:76-912(+)